MTQSLSAKAASDLVNAFVQQEILVETSRQQRNRIFIFQDYLMLFA